ncbi:hypothetical protein BLL36_11135 [Pseudomonas cedrina subsp. cedrina]|uniref:Uncharacterized protein n=1 Tax=Pseudomonas cedrina subsp. cedrina TaxID=76762 RepID=A0A1V2K918_PSECE|nr:hypothetical protein BLL36_11135 [Pseudomonas cedrina subsp. cedrina]
MSISQNFEILTIRILSKKAEAAEASATSSAALSFELKDNEIKLCLDCFDRQSLDFTNFVVFIV